MVEVSIYFITDLPYKGGGVNAIMTVVDEAICMNLMSNVLGRNYYQPLNFPLFLY